MLDPAAAVERVRKSYDANWRAWLLGTREVAVTVDLHAPKTGDLTKADRNDDPAVDRWIREWEAWSLAHPGIRLDTALRHPPRGGERRVVTRLRVSGPGDLGLLDPELGERWERAVSRWRVIRELPGAPAPEAVGPVLTRIVELDDVDFGILLAAAIWFFENPRSGLTMRRVPVVGMHSKWLKSHRALVIACSGTSREASADLDDGTASGEEGIDASELDVLGLLALPAHVDVIVSDERDRARLGGVRSLRAPWPEVDRMPLAPRTVVVVENKESAYPLPDLRDTVIVHSLGNHLNVLRRIGWIARADIVYWGDLDRAGLTLLSRARALLPGTVSILMDDATLREYGALTTREGEKADPPVAGMLRAGESAALTALTADDGRFRRLEQERIPIEIAAALLRRLIGPTEP